jgi:hypothetical protein
MSPTIVDSGSEMNTRQLENSVIACHSLICYNGYESGTLLRHVPHLFCWIT